MGFHRPGQELVCAGVRLEAESGWKLFDMSGAPFEEREAEAGREDAAGLEARMRLQGVLDSLNPGAGILDDGDGSGRHGSKRKNK